MPTIILTNSSHSVTKLLDFRSPHAHEGQLICCQQNSRHFLITSIHHRVLAVLPLFCVTIIILPYIVLLSFPLVLVNKVQYGDPTCSTHVHQQQECVTKLQLKVTILALSLLTLL